jgi:hypothetical protein
MSKKTFPAARRAINEVDKASGKPQGSTNVHKARPAPAQAAIKARPTFHKK